MNVGDDFFCIVYMFHVKSSLPDWFTYCKCHRSLERCHNFGNGSVFWNLHKKMTVVRHDHKCIEQKRMHALNEIQTFDDGSRMRIICKHGQPIFRTCCDKHEALVLYVMALGHACTVSCGARRIVHLRMYAEGPSLFAHRIAIMFVPVVPRTPQSAILGAGRKNNIGKPIYYFSSGGIP
jgi:hypothetical protein